MALVSVLLDALADEVAELVGWDGVKLAAIAFEVLGVPVALPLGLAGHTLWPLHIKPDRFVAYYRVSTAQQGRSGLGLEAQREAVRVFLDGSAGALAEAFTEVESGKNDDRPQLAKALDACRLTGAVLVIAKLDRLSRDAHFLLGLEKAGVEFVAADMPNANRLTVRLMAVIAQEEREMISARTKAALAAAKARGKKLGGNRGGPKVDSAKGRAARSRIADDYARQVGPIALAAWQAANSYIDKEA
jgi:DNA invertase Pin-like site-specific DNA recombinase